MTTAGELARKLNTDPRNVAIHSITARELGVPLTQWIETLRNLPTAEEVAEQVGVSPTTVRRKFRKWLARRGLSPRFFVYYDQRQVMKAGKPATLTVRTLRIPREFVEGVFG